MHYYEVLVASAAFHGDAPLTYASANKLAIGAVVSVPLRRTRVLAIVYQPSPKPAFATKSLSELPEQYVVPTPALRLLDWLRAYYPAPLGTIASLFVPSNLAQHARATPSPRPASQLQPLPSLTAEQQAVIKRIKASHEKTFLIHGDTGTGKTRVYIELAQAELKRGRSVLVLTPEIGLTSQLVRDFANTFGQQVVLFHSGLGPAHRRQAWQQIAKSAKPMVGIGPRSALFLPFANLGLVVVDEAHEPAYKQEQLPRYNGLRVAGQLAAIHQARLVFGTATPLVAEYYFATTKAVPILRMQQVASTLTPGHKDVTVLQIRDREQFSRDPYLSDHLLAALQETLQNKEQALIFLNRRGTARLVLCQVCGWHALCPRCDLPLTFHADNFELRCHTCGYHDKVPASCPICGSSDIIFKNVGTKAIVSSLTKLFPGSVIKRFDTDNVVADRLDRHYGAIHAGEVDILVGTQMLAKGLDLPRLSLVGVVSADSSLSFPDFTAEERTYQLLSQVIGRVGRGHRQGRAIIQTYNPENPALVAAIQPNWTAFYNQQLAERQKFRFPPFCFVLKLSASRKSLEAVIKAADELRQSILVAELKVQVLGPAPSFYERINGTYQWQLIVKAKNRAELLKVVALTPANWTYDLDPSNLL